MANLLYRLSAKTYNDKSEVLVRFYSGNFEQSAKTRISVPIKYWNAHERRLSYSTRYYTQEVAEVAALQKQLDALARHIMDEYLQTTIPEKGWLQRVIDLYSGRETQPSEDRVRLSDKFPEYVTAKNLDVATAHKYEGVQRLLDRYGEKYGVLYADTFCTKDIERIATFMREETYKRSFGRNKANEREITTSRSQNTISSRLRCIRAVCHWIKNKAFDEYKIPTEVYGRPIYLTLEERDQIYAYKELSPAMAIQRDIFIFQCNIGCRVSDLIEFTQDNLTGDGFLQYIMHKGRKNREVTVRVPLTPIAKEIIARYADQQRGGKLLPFIAKQPYNRAIKEVMQSAGLNRQVLVLDKKTNTYEAKPLWQVSASHIARKTFMSAMFKATKSERITSAFTGHADGSKAFKRYTDVDDDMMLDAIQNIISDKAPE